MVVHFFNIIKKLSLRRNVALVGVILTGFDFTVFRFVLAMIEIEFMREESSFAINLITSHVQENN